MRPMFELNTELLKARIRIKRGDMAKAHERLGFSKQTITAYMRGEGKRPYIAKALLDFLNTQITERQNLPQ